MDPLQYADHLFSINHDYWNGFSKRVKELEACLKEGKTPKLERIALMMTERCNFNCVYCNHDNRRSLKTETIKKIIDSSRKLGAKILAISGGEVTLLPDELFETINYAKDFKIFISTNGYFSNDILEKLKTSQIEGINISLDSIVAEKHDELVRVPGSWHTVVESIKELSKHKKVFINTMVTKHNYADLPERLAGFLKMFPDIVDVQLIPPRNAPALYLSLDQIDEYYKSLHRIDKSILERFPLAALKIPTLFGTDKNAHDRASHGCYTFDVNIPCYLTLQELRFAPVRGIYNCGCLQREFEDPLFSMGDFFDNPEATFSKIQQKIMNTIPFAKRCATACGPETSAFNHYLHDSLNK